ncbi:MAG: hypothetical protein LBU14_04175 [Candidatus Peribacteria bacterium]|jgi:hypothetical protein|nr:hypothetical protein [Candidatus Peribacteria bacterium]
MYQLCVVSVQLLSVDGGGFSHHQPQDEELELDKLLFHLFHHSYSVSKNKSV